jgi:methylenetetrahydrofolate dehydrogenase (NADP+) / methenyltetrahydrofolate cyclohydrolase
LDKVSNPVGSGTGAQVIDGVSIAVQLRTQIARGVDDLVETLGVRPGLAVVLVGEDAASHVYVRNKIRQAVAVGMRSIRHFLPPGTSEIDVLNLIARLNEDESVHGILVQFPLPSHISVERVVEAIHPAKDVDGFSPLNVGRAAAGIGEPIIPCTPLGILHLIKTVRSDLTGLSALVIGASNVVGRPMARLLLRERCTVSVAHIDTKDVPERCQQADILVVAAGVPGLVRGSWIKPGATVIDVGITRIPVSEGKFRLVGDVMFEEAVRVAGAITPVPGGVGPMTVAYLLANTLCAARRANALDSLDTSVPKNGSMVSRQVLRRRRLEATTRRSART